MERTKVNIHINVVRTRIAIVHSLFLKGNQASTFNRSEVCPRTIREVITIPARTPNGVYHFPLSHQWSRQNQTLLRLGSTALRERRSIRRSTIVFSSLQNFYEMQLLVKYDQECRTMYLCTSHS